ncbi:tetratricopeptide repeat protein [Pseudoalteromonas sp. 31A1]|uniref:tetratricopeptide repeat protein n=1 Tax=Pseudoalteromonas sp. 31A1 TaxID=2686351 RepID=UPI0013FD5328|nr:tetratricopeptide repeat protein [Pseudoalteromonas sp. 31A1]
MDVYVSSSAGLALNFNGSAVSMYKHGTPTQEEISVESANSILKKNSFYSVTVRDKKHIRQRLYRDTQNSQSLLLFLMLFDGSIDRESKLLLIKELDSVFQKDDECYQYVANVMYSRNLELFDAKKLPNLDDDTSFCVKLLNSLISSQDKIKTLTISINDLCYEYSYGAKVRSLIEGFLVSKKISEKLFSGNLELVQLQQELLFELTPKLKELSDNGAVPFTNQLKSILESYCDSESRKQPSKSKNISSMMDNSSLVTEKFIRSKPKQAHISQTGILESVNKKIDNIKKHLKNGRYGVLTQEIDSLVEYQLFNGGNQYAAISLCRLSESAKRLTLFDLQLEWSLKASKLAPEDYRTYGHVADAYLNLENYHEAMSFFETCLDGDVDSYLFGIVGKARAYVGMHNFPQAWECITEAEKFNDKNANMLFVKGDMLRAAGRYSEALEVYRIIQREVPEDSKGYLGEGSVHAELKSYDKSLEVYSQALSLYSDRETQRVVYCAMSYIYAKTGKFDTAEKLINEASCFSTYEDIFTDLTKARVLHFKGDTAKACLFLTKVATEKPHFHELHSELLYLLTSKKDYKSAIQHYNLITNDFKNKPSIQLKYAMLRKAQGLYLEALTILDELKKSHPKYTMGLVERARILKEQGLFQASREQYKEVLSFNSLDSRALLGIQYLNALTTENGQKQRKEAYPNDSKVSNIEDIEDIEDIEGLNEAVEFAIIKLSSDARASKKIMLKAYHTKLNFKGIYGTQLSACLSIASLKQKQNKAAFRFVKKVESYNDALQKAIIYGEQGKKHLVLDALNANGVIYPEFAQGLKEMVIEKYLKAQNDDTYTLECLLDEQLKVIYRAA